MILRLRRDTFADEWTLGVLTVDYEAGAGPQSFGFTCEDQDRGLNQGDILAEIQRVKIAGETAIPAGRYRVRRTHSPKYGRLMALVEGVPGFRGIRIHAGNDDDDTEGCILPGLSRDVKAGTVAKSKAAADWLDAEIAKVEAAGGVVYLEITRDAAAWIQRPTVAP